MYSTLPKLEPPKEEKKPNQKSILGSAIKSGLSYFNKFTIEPFTSKKKEKVELTDDEKTV